MELCLTIELTDENKKMIEKETTSVFDNHKDFLWYEPLEYRIPLFTWNKVEADLVPKLTEKIKEALFETEVMDLFGLNYVVKIGTRIDLLLKFQREAKYTRIIRTIADSFYGSGAPSTDDFPMVAIARYKIPSKQQYTHLKNELEKIKTDVQVLVSSVSLTQVTEFGKGAKEGKALATIELIPKKATA